MVYFKVSQEKVKETPGKMKTIVDNQGKSR